MTDQYLQEQHAYAIARSAHPESTQTNPEPDERTSWVMLSQNGNIVRLPHEHIRHTTGSRISLDLSGPKVLHGRTPSPFSLRSENGTAYITTQRIIYIPSKPTEEFKSFAAPILNFEDSHISSPWFGSWYWFAVVKPVSQGGIPPDIARVELKFTFKEGGHNEFREKFEELKERLHHIRDIERETGQRVNVPDEPLPAYEAQGSVAGSSSLAPPGSGPGRSDSSASARRAPDEPPPDYDEAQAQTLSMRLEDHIRDEADRDGSDRD